MNVSARLDILPRTRCLPRSPVLRLRGACCAILLTTVAAAGPLDDLAAVVDRSSHRASSHDPTGGNQDSLVSWAPGETHVLLDVDGPGRITHLWFTAARFPNHATLLRDIVLRIFWENSPVPSVEVPLGDFFGLGHGRLYAWQSLPVTVGANPCALNAWWPMPFYRHARVELHNRGERSIRRLYYNIDYELGPIPPGQGLFHAEYRRAPALAGQAREGNTGGADNYVILETEGKGHYVGCVLSVDAAPGGWWGEGDDMIFIDHAAEPTIIGTGSEDYFCNAWGYAEAFSYPFYGCPLLEKRPDGGSRTTVYRWHLGDPVRFSRHIRVTIERLFDPGVLNDYTSVAFWYQLEAVRRREPLPPVPGDYPLPDDARTVREIDATELEPALRAAGIEARSMTAELSAGYRNGGWLRIQTGGKAVELAVPAPVDGTWVVEMKPVNHLIDGEIVAGLPDATPVHIPRRHDAEGRAVHEGEVPFIELGRAETRDGRLRLMVGGNPVIGLDAFRIRRAD